MLYNLFFYFTLRRKQTEFSQLTSTPSMPPFLVYSFYDLRQLLELTISYLCSSSTHPYPFLLKYMCLLQNLDVEDYIMK
jgi:hypothetical protein